MGTTILPCGCAIHSSMFGEREILGVNICWFHTKENQDLIKELVSKIHNQIAPENE